MALMDRSAVLHAFDALAAALQRRGVDGRVYVVGGAAMALAYDHRRSTRDVHAVFAPQAEVAAAVREVADDLGLPPDWLNDAVKGFVPGVDIDAVPVYSKPGLEVAAASARTMLGMKVLASRPEFDAADIRLLAGLLDLSTAEDVLAVVTGMYPTGLIPPRAEFLVAEMFGRPGRG